MDVTLEVDRLGPQGFLGFHTWYICIQSFLELVDIVRKINIWCHLQQLFLICYAIRGDDRLIILHLLVLICSSIAICLRNRFDSLHEK